jgi:hypothetical protein
MQIHSPNFFATPEQIAELDRLGDEIAELSAHLEAATARLLDLIREFDERAGWNHGFRSCAAWLSWRIGLDQGAAREKVRVARALGTLPRLAAALAGGELSYAKVRALTRVATPETEERLLAVGHAGTAEHVERIVRGWRRVDRLAEARESARQQKSRAVHVYPDEDGMVVIRGRLTPEVGALLLRALEAGRETVRHPMRVEDTPTFAQQQADALALVAETALHRGLDPGAPGERYQVVVHVDAASLRDGSDEAELADGAPIAAETARRLACDAALVPLLERAGKPLSVGRKTRSIPPALRRALASRDRGCRFPGCTNHRTVDAHHIEHWANGGATSLDNLVELCRHHHRLLHEGGYTVARAGASFVFRRPDGRQIRPVPRPPRGCSHALRDSNNRGRRPIDPEATVTLWAGERFDLGFNVDALLTFAPPEAPGI